MNTTSRNACEKKIGLKEALEIWASTAKADGDHIDQSRLEVLASEGGMASALPHEMEHLSLCPVCMESWNRLVQAASSGEEDSTVSLDHIETAPDFSMDYCMMQAAASPQAHAVEMVSASGDFTVSILPDMEEEESVMVTLQVAPDRLPKYEGKEAVVRDYFGDVLFQRPITGGRAAALLEEADFKRLQLLSITTK